MVDAQDSFKEDLRFQILRLLEAHPEYSQRELADALGISLGRVNFVLRALVEKGLIKVANFRRSDKRLRYAYVLTPTGIAERALLTGRFLQRKIAEYELIRAEIESLTSEFLSGDPVAATRTELPES